MKVMKVDFVVSLVGLVEPPPTEDICHGLPSTSKISSVGQGKVQRTILSENVWLYVNALVESCA